MLGQSVNTPKWLRAWGRLAAWSLIEAGHPCAQEAYFRLTDPGGRTSQARTASSEHASACTMPGTPPCTHLSLHSAGSNSLSRSYMQARRHHPKIGSTPAWSGHLPES